MNTNQQKEYYYIKWLNISPTNKLYKLNAVAWRTTEDGQALAREILKTIKDPNEYETAHEIARDITHTAGRLLPRK